MARTSKYAVMPKAQSSSFKMWKAGFYLRLSKEDGDIDEEDKYESDSISNQRFIIEDFLVENPDIIVEDIYTDDDYSGANFERPGFEKLMDDVRSGRVNCVIVKDLSRFCRNYIDGGRYLQVFFPEMDIRFIAVIDNVDSFLDPNSVNSCLLGFKNIMNEEVCRDISVKVRSTLNAKRENGEYIGACPYGYKKAPGNKHKLIIDGEAAETVRLIFKLFLEGKALLAIAKRLNELGIPNPARHKNLKLRRKQNSGLWSVQTVRHLLTHPMMAGDLVQFKQEKISYKVNKFRQVKQENWIVIEDTHEAIIDKTTFMNVQEMLKRDTRVSQKTKELGLFSGFLKCADCGMSLQRKFKPKTDGTVSFAYYICRTYNMLKKDACTGHRIRHDNLETAVLTTINKYIDMAVEMNGLIDKINKSPVRRAGAARIKTAIEDREKEKSKVDSILLDLYPDFKSGLITLEQYLSLRTKYETEKTKIENALTQLRITYEHEKDGTSGTNLFLQSFLKFQNIQALSREVLISLIDTIVIHEGSGIEIKFKFKDAFERAAEYIETNKELLINTAMHHIQELSVVGAVNVKEAL